MTEITARGTVAIDDLKIGMYSQLTKQITDRDIELFAEVSTDHNPVHLDDEFAKGTMFKGRIAHGMITASLISAIIGEQLPGHGAIYMGQTLKFMAPVRPGDTVVVRVEVTKIDTARRRVNLDCQCFVGDTIVLKGEALVLAPAG